MLEVEVIFYECFLGFMVFKRETLAPMLALNRSPRP